MRLITSTLLAAATLAAFAPASPANAQQKPVRQGFGLSLGLGQGSAGVTCDGCPFQAEDRLNGLTGYLRLGGYVNPKFFAGLEGTGWMKNSDTFERRVAAISAVFLGYPSATAGFFVRTGAGVLRAVIEDDQGNVAEGNGFTWQAGIGYDIPLGTGAAITPFLTYVQSMETPLYVNGISTGVNLNPNILQGGVAITLR